MSLLSFILNLDTGGLPRRDFSLADMDEELDEETNLPDEGECNGCGRHFHAVHINCFCPARCGGKVCAR
jgi:hypothetical protein